MNSNFAIYAIIKIKHKYYALSQHINLDRTQEMCILIKHVLLRTNDLARMVHFFEQTLELKVGQCPPFSFPGAWLWSGNRSLIHLSELNPVDCSQSDYLINDEAPAVSGTGIIDHIAFSGVDYPPLIERLLHYHLDYFERTVPLIGEHQVFIQGPENLRIEVQLTQKKETKK
ncbi:MAG: lactoylglutathione lyase [Candidatus Thiodiazotropha sp. (ex Codakia rugifera)]|nr:lactoylglutathione lyase [Candidatus Thiodiazotropha sp. (ex Codakia rugifera)]